MSRIIKPQQGDIMDYYTACIDNYLEKHAIEHPNLLGKEDYATLSHQLASTPDSERDNVIERFLRNHIATHFSLTEETIDKCASKVMLMCKRRVSDMIVPIDADDPSGLKPTDPWGEYSPDMGVVTSKDKLKRHISLKSGDGVVGVAVMRQVLGDGYFYGVLTIMR